MMQAATIGFNTEYSEDAPSLEEIHGLSGLTLLEFGTPWCGYCQAACNAVKEAIDEHSDLVHIKILDGKGKRLGRQFAIKLWPTLILLHDGKEVERIVRFTSEEEVCRLLSLS
ncbi:thioredoxin family protein [Marinomonas sp. 5E14-1]|uniref:thioredoxin family protein n=1 Tax=Marinomonas sp. 5E14-1 TaxID=3153922 RepID=UPI00326344C3